MKLLDPLRRVLAALTPRPQPTLADGSRPSLHYILTHPTCLVAREHRRRIRLGLLHCGVVLMGLDALAAVGVATFLGEHFAHIFGATGATLSGASFWFEEMA